MRDLKTLPKAHLHVHLVGALRKSTYHELAEQAGVDAPEPGTYDSFAAFQDTIVVSWRLLRSEAALRRATRELVKDSAAAGAVWVEPSVEPGLLDGTPGIVDEGVDVVLDEGRSAARDIGVGFGLVVASNRELGADHAVATAAMAVRRADDGVVAFGLDGDEVPYPPRQFAGAFELARVGGLPGVPHAGELSGPESVRDAVEVLHARRVIHGVRAVEDPELVAELVTSGTCLDVCPTSNVMLSVVPSLDQHPLPALLAAGVRCSVNADDPLMFGTDLLEEYTRCRADLGLGDEQLAAIARTSLEASMAPRDLVERGLRDIDDWLGPGTAEEERP